MQRVKPLFLLIWRPWRGRQRQVQVVIGGVCLLRCRLRLLQLLHCLIRWLDFTVGTVSVWRLCMVVCQAVLRHSFMCQPAASELGPVAAL